MGAAARSARVRRVVFAGIAFLLAWRIAVLVGVPRRTEVALGLLGFVFHVLFGKAYALVPAYFDRELAVPRAPTIQLPLTAVGAATLALASVSAGPTWLGGLGGLTWGLGAAVFAVTLLWTLRGNVTGTATGTATAKADRRPLDRVANAAIPIALLYLIAGAYALVAPGVGLPPLLDGYPPRSTHLLAAGAATLFLFGVGFRLLPRFFVASPPRSLPGLVIGLGAVGPTLLAVSLPRGPVFGLAALVEAAAVIGYALVVATLFRRTERDRVGFAGILAGAGFGTLGVLIGLWLALDGLAGGAMTAHLRTNLMGFLGLTIVGVTYQFYPPAVGSRPGVDDWTAAVSIGALGAGVLVEVVGLATATPSITALGSGLVLLGATLWAYVLVALFAER